MRGALLAAAFLLIFAGCDASPAVVEVDEAALDDTLEVLITKNFQRPLSNFILPDGDDLQAFPQDPANPLTPEKVALGKLLFFETGLGTNPLRPEGMGTYGCATCHHPDAGFQAGRKQSIGEGGSGWGTRGERRRPAAGYALGQVDAPDIRSPAALNAAYQQTMHWDGSLGAHGKNAVTEHRWTEGTPAALNHLGYEGVETQAMAALTRHRMDRLDLSPLATHAEYQALWEAAFPAGDPISIETVGLAIAAYERTVVASEAPFQKWLRGNRDALTTAEKRGAIAFFGKADCEQCHSGPALNSVTFYALGMPDMAGPDVIGPPAQTLGRGGFDGLEEELFKFKIPQLYNLADSPFLGHGGSFIGIRAVVEYYNDGIPDVPLEASRLAEAFEPLNLTPDEIEDMTVFLTDALRDPDLARYAPQSLPSGNCFPANDVEARRDLGC